MATLPCVGETERIRTFGEPGAGPFYLVRLPWGMSVVMHQLVAAPFLLSCLDALQDRWAPRRIDSLNVRKIAGTQTWSLHSFGLAWDFFATPPGVVPPGGVRWPVDFMPMTFARPFLDRGFRWGATWSDADNPHLEWCAGKPAL